MAGKAVLPDGWGPSSCVCGIDEVGRGCLAGPVVACALILPPSYSLSGLTDSKKLPPKKREELAQAIRECAVSYSIALVGQRTIDRINILQSTFMAMSMACSRLSPRPEFLAIDGNKILPEEMLGRFWMRHGDAPLPVQKAIVRGDSLVPAISAASILAKTYRDALMRFLSSRYPLYGFEKHVGYGTAHHLQMLAEHGPCPLHRRTFRGVL
ncbi:MAG: ribonuclease HII [Desulfovibrio sp.]|nr:ribonuclease HII [Desulfovibrio sp.]